MSRNEHLIGEVEPSRQLPREVHHQQGKKLNIFVLQADECMPGKNHDLAIHGGDGGGRVLMHGHEGGFATTLSELDIMFMDDHALLRELKIDLPALDDVDVHRLVALFEEDLAGGNDPQLQVPNNGGELGIGYAAKEAQLRNDRSDRIKIRERGCP